MTKPADPWALLRQLHDAWFVYSYDVRKETIDRLVKAEMRAGKALREHDAAPKRNLVDVRVRLSRPEWPNGDERSMMRSAIDGSWADQIATWRENGTGVELEAVFEGVDES